MIFLVDFVDQLENFSTKILDDDFRKIFKNLPPNEEFIVGSFLSSKKTFSWNFVVSTFFSKVILVPMERTSSCRADYFYR